MRDDPGTQLRVNVLRALMAERGWTKPNLADASGIHVTNIHRLITGKTELTGLTMARLLRAFPTVHAEDLFDFGRDPVADLDTDTGSAA
jgi:plasmid maintenance system antidote protein VapI